MNPKAVLFISENQTFISVRHRCSRVSVLVRILVLFYLLDVRLSTAVSLSLSHYFRLSFSLLECRCVAVTASNQGNFVNPHIWFHLHVVSCQMFCAEPACWGEGLYSATLQITACFIDHFSAVTQTTIGYLYTQLILMFPLVIHAKNRNRLSSLSLLGRWGSLKERIHGFKKEWGLSFPHSSLFSDSLVVIIFWWVYSRAI